MAIRRVEAEEFTCDGCGKVQVVEDRMDLIGISGNAFEQTSTGSVGTEWFACGRRCAGKAILSALDRENER